MKISQIIEIPSSSSPDDARRRALLNIILIGLGVVIALLLITTPIATLFFKLKTNETLLILGSSLAMLVGILVVYLINRRSGRIASATFLLLLTVVLIFSDSPEQIADGRSLFVFCIPLVMASMLITPVTSFFFAGLNSIIISGIAVQIGIAPNGPAIAGFFLLATISWLSSRSLELALKDLRATNANLDKLVSDRTEDLRKALVELGIEAGRSQAILESIADGVIVFNSDGHAIIANPAISRLLYRPNEEILGATFSELIHTATLPQQNREQIANLMHETGTNLSNFRIEWGKKVLSASAARVKDTNGGLIGTVTVFRDFTREAEVERMKNAFIAIVSHELRTPLNAISGYAEMLHEGIYGPVNEKQANAFERIISNTQRLMHIVNDLLDQAQIEAGKLTIRMRPFKPLELIDNVHGVMDKLALDKGLKLTSEIDPSLPETINGDPYRLQQIAVNLVNNAVKFTDKGSINLRLYIPDYQHWSIEVKDTGRGIPPESINTVFEAFEQADTGVTREHKGVGLGLTIVKRLSTLMNGNVTVTSKLGVGSIFTVTLPMIAANEEAKNDTTGSYHRR